MSLKPNCAAPVGVPLQRRKHEFGRDKSAADHARLLIPGKLPNSTARSASANTFACRDIRA